ncbi:MAG: hypothetical protein JKX75_03915 [Gammaproteobacteria bacterium]|nr:hypothetical protein [Gammaproteobacteria bacterium]
MNKLQLIPVCFVCIFIGLPISAYSEENKMPLSLAIGESIQAKVTPEGKIVYFEAKALSVNDTPEFRTLDLVQEKVFFYNFGNEMMEKAKAMACNKRIRPKSIQVTGDLKALSVALTWESKDLCGD